MPPYLLNEGHPINMSVYLTITAILDVSNMFAVWSSTVANEIECNNDEEDGFNNMERDQLFLFSLNACFQVLLQMHIIHKTSSIRQPL